jgi:hypothetical protein
MCEILKPVLTIPNVFQNLVSGKAGASDVQPSKHAMCKHMVDGGGCTDKDASVARTQILKHIRYNAINDTERGLKFGFWKCPQRQKSNFEAHSVYN